MVCQVGQGVAPMKEIPVFDFDRTALECGENNALLSNFAPILLNFFFACRVAFATAVR